MVKEMVKILFPATKNIDEVVGIIDKYRMKFGLNTDMRLAQFLAQVREEVGPEFKVIRESLNYKEEAVLKMWPNRISISDAEKYARDEDTPKANQEAIANLAYSGRLGNGALDPVNRKKFLKGENFEFNGTPGDFWQGSYLYTVRHSAKLYMNCLKGGK